MLTGRFCHCRLSGYHYRRPVTRIRGRLPVTPAYSAPQTEPLSGPRSPLGCGGTVGTSTPFVGPGGAPWTATPRGRPTSGTETPCRAPRQKQHNKTNKNISNDRPTDRAATCYMEMTTVWITQTPTPTRPVCNVAVPVTAAATAATATATAPPSPPPMLGHA